jgi:hypothetical protein
MHMRVVGCYGWFMKAVYRPAATALLATMLVVGNVSNLMPRAALAAASDTFKRTDIPNGGTIVAGTLGQASLPDATATLLRQIHAELGTRPTVVQVAQNARDHSVALLFTADRDGTPYTGMAMVTPAASGTQAGGAAVYDVTSRFQKTVRSLMQKLNAMTTPSKPAAPAAAAVAMAPAEPLETHPFSDGTGSIAIPADWTLGPNGGAGAIVTDAATKSQVSYNMHLSAIDLSNPRARSALATRAGQAMHLAQVPYTSDPVKAWVAVYTAKGKAAGYSTEIHVNYSSNSGATSTFSGTIGRGANMIDFMASAFVLPPDIYGLWTVSDTHIFLNPANVPRLGNTAKAVLDSVHIDFAKNAEVQAGVREIFKQKFDAQMKVAIAETGARTERVDEAMAEDAQAQEGMHKQAVAMENYSLDRAVVVNTTNGVHSTVDTGFADYLTHDNPNYQAVPANQLLRGVDY